MTREQLALFAIERDRFVDELIGCVIDPLASSRTHAEMKLLELHVEQMNCILAEHQSRYATG